MRRRRGAVLSLVLPAAALALGGCGRSAPGPVDLAADAQVGVAAANPVTVSPLPGTPDASPRSQISFLGGPGTAVSDVRVTGSESGEHGGVLRRYSTGTGESFLPTKPFLPGERVTVSARLGGGSQARSAHTTFTVAQDVAVSLKEFGLDHGNARQVQHFSSAPTLTPSTVTITTPESPAGSPGYLFLAPYQGEGTAGPMIADQQGQLVWFHPLPEGIAATNFQIQSYGGGPVLTWWQGRILEVGFGQGEDVVYDTAYRQVAVIRAGNGYQADLHVLRLTPEGTAWIDAYWPVKANLSRIGRSAKGVISDSVVQEVDIRTGLVMWEWHALGHIPIGDSKNPPPPGAYPWDYTHINAVDPGPEGDVLLSFRNTWSLDDVDLHSGGLRWTLGGVASSFALAPGATFYWQYDASFQQGGLISLFDNGSDPPEEKRSRGLLLSADLRTHRVSLIKALVNPRRSLLASSQGSMQRLPGGNWLLGYGGLPDFTEFDASGYVLLDGRLGKGVQNFRAYLSPWQGQAPGAPSLAVVPNPGGPPIVAVSWNGSTEVSSWRLLQGSSPGALSPVRIATRSGFQTTIALPQGGPYVAVQALSGDGAVLGVSPTIKV